MPLTPMTRSFGGTSSKFEEKSDGEYADGWTMDFFPYLQTWEFFEERTDEIYQGEDY